MNYEKGEQIKSVEEFVKEVLAKDRLYYVNHTLFEKGEVEYYEMSRMDMRNIEEAGYFHAIPKKEKVKYFQCWYKLEENYTLEVPPFYFKNLADFKCWVDAECRNCPSPKYGLNENCFIEVEV